MGYGFYQSMNEILEDIAFLKFLNFDIIELFEFGVFYNNFEYDGLTQALNSSRSDWIYPEFEVQRNFQDSLYSLGIIIADALLDFF